MHEAFFQSLNFLRPHFRGAVSNLFFLYLLTFPSVISHCALQNTYSNKRHTNLQIKIYDEPNNIYKFQRNYHLEFKKKWCNLRYFLYVWNVLLRLLIRFLFHLHHSKLKFCRKLIACGTVLSITHENLQLHNNKTIIFSFRKCR